MVFDSFAGVSITAAVAGCIALAALWITGGLERRLNGRDAARAGQEPRRAVMILDGDAVVDMSAAAREILNLAPGRVGDRGALIRLLSVRFPDIGSLLNGVASREQIHIFSRDRSEIATATRHDRRIRLTLTPAEDPDDMIRIDRPTMAAIQDELTTLRTTTDKIPVLVWRQDQTGDILWSNRAYLDTCAARAPDWLPGTWPIPRLFDVPDAALRPDRNGSAAPRVSLGDPDDPDRTWFHLSVSELDNRDRLIAAMDVNSVVEAENSLRSVVQSLSKTFADLPIGLAVFTRDRRLTLFNPALVDLTTIAPEKLMTRPSIFGFFDELRTLQMMPEPKNYASWRDQITDLEASASDGNYEETWHLPFGRTFRVTGRPQIGGALALLFEDISTEIGTTRRLRGELETSQSVIDAFTDAVAVFSRTGVLITSNKAYDALWSRNSREGLDDLDISQAVAGWAKATAPTPMWHRVETYVTTPDRRDPWGADARLEDGRGLSCMCRQIAGGATMVTFAVQTAGDTHLRPAPTGPNNTGEARRAGARF
ncbi:diguanylate cyclase [Oceaniglobus indicus]|uniref:diguanylate cyclase n=1 Tax=Oceaniglobus indicus TaxID=2047749 RepID=UPI000C196AB5|nr:diguanylate cyclase [Oceaniglobus indicus]